jgi:hypothetical protein
MAVDLGIFDHRRQFRPIEQPTSANCGDGIVIVAFGAAHHGKERTVKRVGGPLPSSARISLGVNAVQRRPVLFGDGRIATPCPERAAT